VTTSSYKLEDLARRAGVSPRTVRYYVQRGLVPAPAFRGPDTAYGEEQLAALLAVKKLQEEFWPLEAIASTIAGRSIEELHRIGEGKLHPRKPSADADAEEPESPPSKRRAPKAEASAPLSRSRVERVELARGVTLLVDESAGEDERALAVEIERLAQRRNQSSQ
jgi:Ca-activated chloride channel family protein